MNTLTHTRDRLGYFFYWNLLNVVQVSTLWIYTHVHNDDDHADRRRRRQQPLGKVTFHRRHNNNNNNNNEKHDQVYILWSRAPLLADSPRVDNNDF